VAQRRYHFTPFAFQRRCLPAFLAQYRQAGVVVPDVRRKRPTMDRMMSASLFIVAMLCSCGGYLPHATYDDRHFYLNAAPWFPVFQEVDSISSVDVFLKEEVISGSRMDKKTFSRAGTICSLTLWRYPIDTTTTESTGEGIVEGDPGVPGIVTRIGYTLHSESVHRNAKIDSLGKFSVPLAEGSYLLVLSVGGYYSVVIKDLEIRAHHHSILQTTLRKPGIFIY
jgi:hypothetical protein